MRHCLSAASAALPKVFWHLVWLRLSKAALPFVGSVSTRLHKPIQIFFGIHASFLPCVSSFLYVDSFFVCRYTFPNFLPLSEACRVLLLGLFRLCMCKGLPEYDRVEGGVPF